MGVGVRSPYQLFLYGKNAANTAWERVCEIADFDNLRLTNRFNDAHAFTFEMPATNLPGGVTSIEDLRGKRLVLYRTISTGVEKLIFTGAITRIAAQRRGNDRFWTVDAAGDLIYLRDRLAFPVTNPASNSLVFGDAMTKSSVQAASDWPTNYGEIVSDLDWADRADANTAGSWYALQHHAVAQKSPFTISSTLTSGYRIEWRMGFIANAILQGAAHFFYGAAVNTGTTPYRIKPQWRIVATSGAFTVTYNGQTTAALAYTDSTATVQAAIEGLSSVGAGNATVTGSSGNYLITLLNALEDSTNAITIAGAGATLYGGCMHIGIRNDGVTFETFAGPIQRVGSDDGSPYVTDLVGGVFYLFRIECGTTDDTLYYKREDATTDWIRVGSVYRSLGGDYTVFVGGQNGVALTGGGVYSMLGGIQFRFQSSYATSEFARYPATSPNTDTPQAVLESMIEKNAITGNCIAERSGFALTAVDVTGASSTLPVFKKTRWDNLLEMARDVAETGGVALQAYGTTDVTVYVGDSEDISDAVEFSDARGNLGDYEVIIERPRATHLIVGGEVTDPPENRFYTELSNVGDKGVWGHIEAFVERVDVTGGATVVEAEKRLVTQEEFPKFEELRAIRATLYNQGAHEWLRDWQVGAIVKIVAEGTTFYDRVREVVAMWSHADGDVVTAATGSVDATATPSELSRVLRRLNRRIMEIGNRR